MTALVLEPHGDDAALFCAFSAIRHQATIITVTTDGDEQREWETSKAAADELGCKHEQWPYRADDPDWQAIELAMRMADERLTPDVVFAPWPEKDGHPQHNALAAIASRVYGDRVRWYTTYRYGGPRTTGTPVPFEPAWVVRKLRALACFESQILRGPWRMFVWGLEEYERAS